eukprot:s1804_g16.t1
MAKDMTFTVVDFTVDSGEGMTKIWGRGDPEMFLPILHPQVHDMNIADAFCGLGGWSHGAEWNGAQPSLMIEIDRSVAEVCAKNHGLPVLSIDEAIQAIAGQCLPKSFVLHADVLSPMVYVIAGFMGISTWLASPPCQPWSKAGRLKGLCDPDGAVFAGFVFWTGVSHARCLNLENVPGLPSHEHFGLLRKVMSESGFDLVLSSQDKVFPVLPIMRVRWLATCVRKGILFSNEKLSMVSAVFLPKTMPGVGTSNSIGLFGCVQNVLEDWEVAQCVPDADVFRVLGNPEFLPLNMRGKEYMKMNPTQVLSLRTKDVRQPLPNVMAAQGSQHQLPEDLLSEKGLYSFLLSVNQCLRFATPFEICAAMGFPCTTGLPDAFHEAWHLVGNALSVPQAALQCFRSWVLLGDMSGFTGELKSVADLCQLVLDRKCDLAKFQVVRLDGLMKLQPLTLNSSAILTTIEDSSDEEIEDFEGPGLAKKTCVSPTWHCLDEEPTLIPELNREECPNLASMTVGTKKVQVGMPFFFGIHHNGHEVAGDQVLVKLMHSQGFWTACFVIPQVWPVKVILQSVLEHAKQEHFDHIEVNGSKVWFGSTPIGASQLNIFFRPFCFARTVVTTFMELGLAVEVDVTWKFQDLCAYIATEAAVLPSCLQIMASGEVMKPEAYVLATNELHFQAIAITMDLGIPNSIAEPEVIEVRNPVHTDEGTLFHPGIVRFTMRNPKWGTIRSCAVPKHETVAHVIERLLPHFMKDAKPIMCSNQIQVDPAMLVSQLPTGEVSIFFPTAKPWPVADVVVSRFSVKSAFSSSNEEVTTMWVKGPFDFRAHLKKLPKNDTLLHVLAKYLSEIKNDLTIIPMQSGKGLDPRLYVHQINHEATLDFRVCALPGGAKNNPKLNEANANKLKPILAQRGVPEEGLAARAALIVGAVDSAELTTILSKDEHSAWNELKIKANQAKIRMITNSELKDHQKLQRKKAAEGSFKLKESKKAHVDRAKKADNEPLKKVFIDPKHFICPTGKIGSIELHQWGPDQSGIAIATTAEANKLMPVTKISPDALALVVLTREVFAGQTPIALPATEITGKPILTSAVVLNFGDVEVQCKPNLPKVDLQEVPTATLEVFIMRELVTQWQDVQNPLNYLGLQLPEIRKGQVISSWNFRTYDADRQKCKHDLGVYAHGFVRIPEEQLHATLIRSGQAGVFVQVKGPNKKPDPRYGVIAMHSHTLEDVLKLAKTLKNVLGVVQLGQNGVYALRARREHVQEIRRNALPQGISMQEGEIQVGAKWWILRNLNTSTTCDAVTTALHELGWDASAIRPTGRNAWLVCATMEPPASHLCIGSDYVAVMPVRSQSGQKTAEGPKTAIQFGANFCSEEQSGGDATTPTTVASRVEDIKTDIRTDLEEKLTNLIQDRMKECDMRISTLADTVEHVQTEIHEVQDAVEGLTSETKTEFASIRGDIANGNASIMSQMQNLFSKMQTELQSTLSASKEAQETEAKRPRH